MEPLPSVPDALRVAKGDNRTWTLGFAAESGFRLRAGAVIGAAPLPRAPMPYKHNEPRRHESIIRIRRSGTTVVKEIKALCGDFT
jgi:hypothetical protein